MKRLLCPVLACILLLACLAGCTGDKNGIEKWEGYSNRYTVTVDGIEMDYAKFGTGNRYMVLLPGLSIKSAIEAADETVSAFSRFSDDYTVYFFARRSNAPEGYTPREMAADTAAVMNYLGISDADVFGASQGGMIGQYLAIDYPELVHKLALGSSISRGNDTFNTVIGRWIDLAAAGDAEGLAAATAEDVYSASTLRRIRTSFIRTHGDATEEELQQFLIMAKACIGFYSYDDLDKIKCPVLVIGCEGDGVVTGEAAREIAEKLGCELYMYDDEYGHAVYAEASDYRDHLAEFFDEE